MKFLAIAYNVSDNRSFLKRSERKFGKLPSRGIFRLSLVRRGFILASLLFYQIKAKMKAKRPPEFSFKNYFCVELTQDYLCAYISTQGHKKSNINIESMT